MTDYRVVDLTAQPSIEMTVAANSQEQAANKVLGGDFVRIGPSRMLRAKVYFAHPDQAVSMVRLYAKVGDSP